MNIKLKSQKLLPEKTLLYYLQNSPEYLGKKKVRMKKRSNLLQNRESVKQFAGDGTDAKIESFTITVLCFDYDMLDAEILTSYVDFANEKDIE